MTRRFFFGLIPALLAAAKWPTKKCERPCFETCTLTVKKVAVTYRVPEEMLATEWIDMKDFSEIKYP